MSESTLKPVEQPKPVERKRERSTISFPYNDLADAIETATAVHELGDRCSHDQLAPRLGNSVVDSGSYNLKVATAKHFSLINRSKDGATLTPLGHRIVDPTQATRARADAFLEVPLYRAVYDQYRGNSLPPTNGGLETVLVSHGVAEKQKDKARQALIRSAEQAGYFNSGRDRLVYPPLLEQPIPPKESDKRKGDGGKDGSGGGRSGLPLLIQGLVDKLPLEKGSWSADERKQWLDAVPVIVDMVLKTEPLQLPSPSSGNSAYLDPSGDR